MAATPAVVPEGAEVATVAAGCFWGVEHLYVKHFGHGKGVLETRVGYIGGATDNPSYRAVCSGTTGHAEATQIIFDPKKVSYRDLLLFFYRMHDATQVDRQGPDTGTQYRSAIFFHTPEQETEARAVTAAVAERWWKSPVATQIIPAGRWYDAEEYHQLYLDKNPHGYECPSHFIRDFPDL
ncbi:unnamed protein product [Parascedosporium putredinis]|uniref:peptide-methionine (S)-S-oxide reductase n=1 Tax=Parascedosporium putredinis TaxID=1442378 RepID=A0A9P1H9E7_9PEZI|nr:unnamed protein product [Parascedosporium putredinis]CAI8001812.1 unnamed protein product [Parascedosporium putredinis]